ncbi:Putative zinc-or iron-chelating domain-containing protein [Marivirga sericea]|uniref:Putative zinc-or iron-chelating domain-containing protein n=1 Tax=Marivirga sericea TaxID=1028 RepID=A0A1X7JD57_9BACT|nr:YkgJ family cysteine cluster protein [Marivirga sericea]SMG25036.1 Putative zinc-or iron-chelating domain-containing protein [Marivirga sericea]
MTIKQKVLAVEKLFKGLDDEITEFRKESGIYCFTGCGKCCNKPDIEASPLEFLPLAYHWFSQGRAEAMYLKLETNSSLNCLVYQPLSVNDKNHGHCSEYEHRGLICRLFGYGAGKDKYGQLRMVTCKLIKEQQVDNYEKAVEMLKSKSTVPVFADYYQKLMQIDFRLAKDMLPINEAIQAALEAVMQYYSYRPFPVVKGAA